MTCMTINMFPGGPRLYLDRPSRLLISTFSFFQSAVVDIGGCMSCIQRQGTSSAWILCSTIRISRSTFRAYGGGSTMISTVIGDWRPHWIRRSGLLLPSVLPSMGVCLLKPTGGIVVYMLCMSDLP